MNNSYITIIKEERTDLSRKRVPLNQNECTANFRTSVPFEQNLHVTTDCGEGSIEADVEAWFEAMITFMEKLQSL